MEEAVTLASQRNTPELSALTQPRSLLSTFPRRFSPWARRLISLAGYMGATQGGTPQPLIQLEYRLRVRGIMLPRR